MVQRIKMCASKNLTDVWYVCLKPVRPRNEHELALPTVKPRLSLPIRELVVHANVFLPLAQLMLLLALDPREKGA